MKVFEKIKESDREEVVKQIHEFARMCLFCSFAARCRIGETILLCNVKAELEREVD